MGHLHFGTQVKMLLDALVENPTSLQDVIDLSMEKKIPVTCSEGDYMLKDMVQQCFEVVVNIHQRIGVIEPVITTPEQQKAFDTMRDSYNDDADSPVLKDFYSIPWRFQDGKKDSYIKGEIEILRSVTL